MYPANRTRFASALSGGLLAVFAACSAPDPKDVKSTATEAPLTECSTTPAALALQSVETPGYNNSIKTILDNSCAVSGCHVAGAQSPDLSTYALAAADAADSRARMDSTANPMPPGGLLNQATRTLFAAWITAGTPENDVLKQAEETDGGETDGGTEAAGDGTTAADPATPAPTTPADPAADANCVVKNEKRTELNEPDFDYLLKSADVKACHDTKKVYDRNTKACGTATFDLTWCHRIGITEKFKAIKMNATTVLNKALGDGKKADDIGDGFIIDQCGVEPSGAPVVFFIRLVKPPEVPGLKVRVLSVDTTKSTQKVAETTEE